MKRANIRRGHFISNFQENIHQYKLKEKYKEFEVTRKVKGPEILLVDIPDDSTLRKFRRLLIKEFRDYEKSLGSDYNSPA